jgi:hypothetical protein
VSQTLSFEEWLGQLIRRDKAKSILFMDWNEGMSLVKFETSRGLIGDRGSTASDEELLPPSTTPTPEEISESDQYNVSWINGDQQPPCCYLCAHTARAFNLPFNVNFRDSKPDGGDVSATAKPQQDDDTDPRFTYETLYVHAESARYLHLDCYEIMRSGRKYSERVIFGFGNGDDVFRGGDGDRIEGEKYAWGVVNSWNFDEYVQFILRASFNPSSADSDAISNEKLPDFAVFAVDSGVKDAVVKVVVDEDMADEDDADGGSNEDLENEVSAVGMDVEEQLEKDELEKVQAQKELEAVKVLLEDVSVFSFCV